MPYFTSAKSLFSASLKEEPSSNNNNYDKVSTSLLLLNEADKAFFKKKRSHIAFIAIRKWGNPAYYVPSLKFLKLSVVSSDNTKPVTGLGNRVKSRLSSLFFVSKILSFSPMSQRCSTAIRQAHDHPSVSTLTMSNVVHRLTAPSGSTIKPSYRRPRIRVYGGSSLMMKW